MTPEGMLRDHLKARARALGMTLRKLSYEGRRGAPDWLVMCPNGFGCIELKSEEGKVHPLQQREHRIMRMAGMRVYVCRNAFQIDMVLDEINGGSQYD